MKWWRFCFLKRQLKAPSGDAGVALVCHRRLYFSMACCSQFLVIDFNVTPTCLNETFGWLFYWPYFCKGPFMLTSPISKILHSYFTLNNKKPYQHWRFICLSIDLMFGQWLCSGIFFRKIIPELTSYIFNTAIAQQKEPTLWYVQFIKRVLYRYYETKILHVAIFTSDTPIKLG